MYLFRQLCRMDVSQNEKGSSLSQIYCCPPTQNIQSGINRLNNKYTIFMRKMQLTGSCPQKKSFFGEHSPKPRII